MKLSTYIICLVLSASAFAKGLKRNYTYPLSRYDQMANFREIVRDNEQKSVKKLQEIKFHMMNGRFEQAKLLLKEVDIEEDFSKKIQYRYLAMIHFIEGHYEGVIEILNNKHMSDFTTQSKYCHLNVLSHLILNKIKNLKPKWNECQKVLTSHSSTNLLWLRTIVDLKLNRKKNILNNLFDGVSIDNMRGDYLRLYLKLALYLNKQDKIIQRFQFFNESTLENAIFRELMGMNYYRNLNLVKAFDLLDVLDTPNTEVFKGNLFLTQKKYDDAFAQYKLALTKKDNSSNALERLIPLSWKLLRWNEGREFITKFDFTRENYLQKYILLAAFNTMADNHDEVRKNIRAILGKTNKSEPVELYQIIALNSIQYDELYKLENTSASSCIKKDGMHCWYLFFHNIWTAPTETLKKDQQIHNDEISLVDYYTAQQRDEKIDEEIFVEQKDIEELDNDLIKLIPTN